MGSSKLPTLTQKRILRALARLDVLETGKGKGSHVGVQGPTGRRSLIASGSVPAQHLATILKQLEIDEDDFLNAI